MKLTVRLGLTFGAILMVTVVTSTGLLMANSYSMMVASARDSALVLIRTFESQVASSSGIDGTALQNRVQSLAKTLPEVVEFNVYQLGDQAQVVASNATENLGKKADPEDLEAAKKDQTVVLFSREGDRFLIDVTAPLHSGPTIDHVVGLQLDLKNDETALIAFFAVTLAVTLVSILVGLVIIFLTSRWLVRPLVDMGTILRTMEESQDLKGRLKVDRQDEIGRLAGSFNSFLDTLAGLVRGLKVSETEIAGIADHLGDHASRTDASVQSMGTSLAALEQEAEKLGHSMGQSTRALGDSTASLHKLGTVIVDQSAAVSEASSSIEEVLGNIASVTSLAEKMADRFDLVIETSREGKQVQEATALLVSEISQHSDSLFEANLTIASIAGQTGLLAMNAAIEAAHAGEAGRGFSVVADEIRKLADNASTQSQVIQKDIGAVQKAIEAVVLSSATLGTAFDQVDAKIQETAGIVRTVKDAMAEQGEGSRQILHVLERLNALTQAVRDGAGAMTSDNQTLTAEVSHLEGNAATIRASLETTAAGVTQFSGAVHEIAATVGIVRNTIHGIEKTLGRLQV